MEKNDVGFILLVLGLSLFLFVISSRRDYESLSLWKGVSVDWNNCCSNYCKVKTMRKPSGLTGTACFVECGKPCCSHTNCPSGCPYCQDGICQSNVRVPY